MEQIDKGITSILKKARSEKKGQRKGKRGCKEKMIKYGAVTCLNLIIKKKQGKKCVLSENK